MSKLSQGTVTQSLETAVTFFKRHSLDYLLIGGLALSAWGKARTTLDVDFMILIDAQEIKQLKQWMSQEGLKIDQKWLKWNPLLRSSQVRTQMGPIPLDFMLPRDDHDRASFKRKKRRKIDRSFCNLIAPEDFILQKLKVGRPRDFEDAVTVLDRQKEKLNMSYLKRWAGRLGISKELDYIVYL